MASMQPDAEDLQTQTDGAVGAYNGIVFADLDNNNQDELYVAGSLGLRRWVP